MCLLCQPQYRTFDICSFSRIILPETTGECCGAHGFWLGLAFSRRFARDAWKCQCQNLLRSLPIRGVAVVLGTESTLERAIKRRGPITRISHPPAPFPTPSCAPPPPTPTPAPTPAPAETLSTGSLYGNPSPSLFHASLPNPLPLASSVTPNTTP